MAATPRRAQPAGRGRRSVLARGLGVAFVLVWVGVLVWLGVVLVRLKAAGPEALRVPDQTGEVRTTADGFEEGTGFRED